MDACPHPREWQVRIKSQGHSGYTQGREEGGGKEQKPRSQKAATEIETERQRKAA